MHPEGERLLHSFLVPLSTVAIVATCTLFLSQDFAILSSVTAQAGSPATSSSLTTNAPEALMADMHDVVTNAPTVSKNPRSYNAYVRFTYGPERPLNSGAPKSRSASAEPINTLSGKVSLFQVLLIAAMPIAAATISAVATLFWSMKAAPIVFISVLALGALALNTTKNVYAEKRKKVF